MDGRDLAKAAASEIGRVLIYIALIALGIGVVIGVIL